MLFVSQQDEQQDNYQENQKITDYLNKHNYPFHLIGPDMSETFVEHQQALLFNTDIFVLGEFSNKLLTEENSNNSEPYLYRRKQFTALHH